jgi:hypothetical protein
VGNASANAQTTQTPNACASPQFAFSTFEKLVTNYVTEPYDPMSRVPEIDEQINRVVTAVSSAVTDAKKSATQTVETRVLAPAQAMRVAANNLMDERVVMPASQAKLRFKSLKGDLSKKAEATLERKLAAVREFSANELKAVIHIGAKGGRVGMGR